MWNDRDAAHAALMLPDDACTVCGDGCEPGHTLCQAHEKARAESAAPKLFARTDNFSAALSRKATKRAKTQWFRCQLCYRGKTPMGTGCKRCGGKGKIAHGVKR